MAIKIDCPRCNSPLSVPRKKIGQYVNCPRCRGRFWVPEGAADSPGSQPPVLPAAAAGSAPAPPSPQPPPPPPGNVPATISMGSEATLPPGGARPETPIPQTTPSPQGAQTPPSVGGAGSPWRAVPPASSASPPPAAKPPRPGQRVARFVSAEASESTLKLTEDGQLPELRLRDGQQKQRKEPKSTTINPLVLFGLLSISVALSISLVVMDVGPRPSSHSEGKVSARRQIEDRFFPRRTAEEPGYEKPREYQKYLMEAQQANRRDEYETERKLYGRVLDMLRQEIPAYVRQLPRGSSEYKKEEKNRSVTGSWSRDKELEELICILLGND
jgi:hypothetical protein